MKRNISTILQNIVYFIRKSNGKFYLFLNEQMKHTKWLIDFQEIDIIWKTNEIWKYKIYINEIIYKNIKQNIRKEYI